MMLSSSTSPAASACRMTSAPPAMLTSLSRAASTAIATASATPSTKTKASPSGCSSGRCVTTKTGMPHGFSSPQWPAASYIHRPHTTAPPRAIASSSHALSSPVASEN